MIAAGLVWMLPATAARAQVSMSYDSLVYGYPPSQSYYYATGYDSVYTEPSTGVFLNGGVAPARTVAPYAAPPYGMTQQGYGVSASSGRTTGIAAIPTRVQTARQRRGLLIRRKK